MIASCLRRGTAAGLLAGHLGGLFAFFFGKPFADQAVDLEDAAAVGDSLAIGGRTTFYLMMVALSLRVVLTAW